MPAETPPPAPDMSTKELAYGFGVALLIIASTALVLALGLWVGKGVSLPQLPVALPSGRVELPSLLPQTYELAKTSQWLNCNGTRGSLIEESDRLYLACDSGILVITPQGQVIDQFSMADGLKNNFVNALVKQGSTLYAGHQDGFSVINLTNRSVKNVSVEHGLINGSNIILAADRQYLWVGTFDGIARYDTQTGEIKNFHEELRTIGSKLSTTKVVVSAKAVYFTFSAHAYSNGGLARYDKTTETFEIVPRAKFGNDKTRLDINDLINYDGVIIASDWTDVWVAEDKPEADWTRHEGIQAKVQEITGGQFPIVKVLAVKDGQPLILSDNLLFAYNLETREVKVVYPERWEGEAVNVLWQAQPAVLQPDVLWFNKGPGLNLIRFDLKDYSSRRISLQDRPSTVNHMLGVINEQPVFVANYGEIWQIGTRGFEKLMTAGPGEIGVDHGPGGYAFEPIPGTSKVFVFFQTCGMGCNKPNVTIFDYVEQTIKPVDVSKEILAKLGPDAQGDFGFGEMNFKSFANNQAIFHLPFIQPVSVVTYDYATNIWSLRAANTGEVSAQADTMRCNPVYTLTNNRFDPATCVKEMSQFRFAIGNPGGRSTLTQVDKTSLQSTVLTPTLTPKRYSPFEGEFYIPAYSFGVIAENKFWLATNLGLPYYDPAAGTWQLFDTSKGLVTNEIMSFAVTPKALWTVTENGGLAGIKR